MAFDSRLLSGIGVLAAVVDAGSFVRAGEALGITQSGVSRAIARLENRVGIRLFHRTARSLRLTEEGRLFYDEVVPHLSAIEDAAIEAQGARANVRGRLRVNTDGAFGTFVLAPNIERFLSRHPDLRMGLEVHDGLGDLLADGFDVSVRFGEPESSSLICRLLMRTKVLTCASPAYIERHGMPTHPGDLAAHRCVGLRDPSTGRAYGWQFIKGDQVVDIEVPSSLIVNDTGTLLGACMGGQGIAQPLALYAEDFIRDGRLVQLLPDWAEEDFPLYVYYRAGPLIPAKLRAFLDFLVELTANRR